VSPREFAARLAPRDVCLRFLYLVRLAQVVAQHCGGIARRILQRDQVIARHELAPLCGVGTVKDPSKQETFWR